MKGVITVGSGGGPGPTTTTATAADSNVACHHAEGGGAPLGRQAGHLPGGLGLFAVGALLALVLPALHVRLPPASTATSASLVFRTWSP